MNNDAISIVKLTDGSFGGQLMRGYYAELKPGRHASAQFSIAVQKEIAMEKIKGEIAGTPLGIAASGADETILFQGILRHIAIREQSGYAIVNGNLVSGTILLDTEVKSRSFQDISMTYKDIIEKVLEDTPDAGAVFAAGEYDKAIEMPIIQYKETDWAFINRLASRCKSCIIPDISQSKPWFYFGVKQNGQEVAFGETEYNQVVCEKFYRMGAEDNEWKKGDHYYCDVDSTQNYEIGDLVTFKDKSLMVCEKSAVYVRQEVIFTYKLAKETYNEYKRYDNTKISGMSLHGTVLETDAETLKIHLDIDKEQDPGTAYPYHWVPASGNLMYLMPKIGTQVSLYFSNSDEHSAKAVNCVRTNGGSDCDCEGMGDFNNRCLTTEHGKQMYFHPGTMGFIGGSGQISQTDETGTDIQSSLKIKMQAEDTIEVNAPHVTLGAKLMLNAKQGGG